MQDRIITLNEILEAREKRAHLRQNILSNLNELSGKILLQITVNTPGNLKNSPMILDIFREGVDRLSELFNEKIIKTLIHENLITGPEGFMLIKQDSLEAKKSSTNLEEQHLLGRLWDIDIYRSFHDLVSRVELDLPFRSCYICSAPAHECARSKKHNLKDLEFYILKLYSSFQSLNSNSGLK